MSIHRQFGQRATMDNLMMNTSSDGIVRLTDIDHERLFRVISASCGVRYRNQFFLWSQGLLQSVIPHEVMICALGEHNRSKLFIEHFSSYPLPAQDVESILDREGGVLRDATRIWVDLGEHPLLVCNSNRESPVYRKFESILFRYAFPNMVVHGMPGLSGCPGTLIMAANLPQPLRPEFSIVLDLIVPYIHTAFLRVLANERVESASTKTPDSSITPREVEILQWVRDGKSNQEIGRILSISPLTVKNHVQKILRKLNSQNRAQAVGKAISLQIIKTGLG